MATIPGLLTAREFGLAIRERRAELGLTQQVVADRARVSRPWLVRLESGHAGAELAKTLAVARALRLTVTLVEEEASRAGPDAPVVDLDRHMRQVT